MVRLNGDCDTYTKRREFSDTFLWEVKKIVGPLMMATAPRALDLREATDLIVLTYSEGAVAARVRTRDYFEEYPFDITMRLTGSEWGSMSEYEKIKSGFADYFFYAFAAEDDNPIAGFRRWYFMDLKRWRHAMINNGDVDATNRSRIRSEVHQNPKDGKWFVAQDIRSFPPALEVIPHHDIPPPGIPYYPAELFDEPRFVRLQQQQQARREARIAAQEWEQECKKQQGRFFE